MPAPSQSPALAPERERLLACVKAEWFETCDKVDTLRYRMDALLEAVADTHSLCHDHPVERRSCAKCRLDREIHLSHECLRETEAK